MKNNTKLSILISILIVIIVFTTVKYNQPDKIFAQSQNIKIETSIAEQIHQTETWKIPSNVDTFIMLIPNEAHESWSDEKHKLITDKNAYVIPTNLVMYNGTKLVFLNADAPWDTPHPHDIRLINTSNENNNYSDNNSADENNDNNTIISTETLQYANFSKPISLNPGKYLIKDTDYETKPGYITVLANNNQDNSSLPNKSNFILGGFYTPTSTVENNKDNDGNVHPGSLTYFRNAFEKNGFQIISSFNFTYGICNYCPGGYWPDNKSANHTLIIYKTNMPLDMALGKLQKLVKDNVYV